MISLTPTDKNGLGHGLWIQYWLSNIHHKGEFSHGKYIAYHEDYTYHGLLISKKYYIV